MVINDSQGASLKQEFVSIISSVNRPGIDNLVSWMENNSDFFTCPASCHFHGAFKYGLVQHSLNVYKAALAIKEHVSLPLALPEKQIENIPEDSLKIVCLMHDLCKANMYKETLKFFKDEQNDWQKYITYEIEDSYPLGHGEKSVILLQNFIRLHPQEAIAIRFHMGMSDVAMMSSPYTKGPLLQSFNSVPLLMIVMLADMHASFMQEKEIDQKKENLIY